MRPLLALTLLLALASCAAPEPPLRIEPMPFYQRPPAAMPPSPPEPWFT